MSKYISGEESLNLLKYQPIELLRDIIDRGLQPYDEFLRPIPPPDVTWHLKKILKITRTLHGYPQIKELINCFWEELKCSGKSNKKDRDGEHHEIDAFTQLQFIFAEERGNDKIASELEALERYCEDVLSCRNRNSRHDINSWEKIDLNNLPIEMIVPKPTQKKRGILALVTSRDTLYLRRDVEKILSTQDIKALIQGDTEIVHELANNQDDGELPDLINTKKGSRTRVNDYWRSKVEAAYRDIKASHPDLSRADCVKEIIKMHPNKITHVNRKSFKDLPRTVDTWLKKYIHEQS